MLIFFKTEDGTTSNSAMNRYLCFREFTERFSKALERLKRRVWIGRVAFETSSSWDQISDSLGVFPRPHLGTCGQTATTDASVASESPKQALHPADGLPP